MLSSEELKVTLKIADARLERLREAAKMVHGIGLDRVKAEIRMWTAFKLMHVTGNKNYVTDAFEKFKAIAHEAIDDYMDSTDTIMICTKSQTENFQTKKIKGGTDMSRKMAVEAVHRDYKMYEAMISNIDDPLAFFNVVVDATIEYNRVYAEI